MQQIRLQITFCHFLNAPVGVGRNPLSLREIVFQRSMARGTMCGFADEPKLQLRPPVASNRKSHRIVSPFFWEPRTTRRVTQIAKLPQLPIRRFRSLVAGRAAMPSPSPAKR
jgi:hypothetical protein